MMKRSWKKVQLAACALAAGAVLIGCGAGQRSASSAETKAAQPISASSAETTESAETKETDSASLDDALNADGSEAGTETGSGAGDSADAADVFQLSVPPEIPGLSYESTLQLEDAEQFQVFSYSGGYQVLAIRDIGEYLLVPEGAAVPADLPEGLTVLQKPLDRIYVAATSAASVFDALDAMDRVAFFSLRKEDWKIDAPKQAYDAGTVSYGGSYSAPDYESLLKSGCDLAIESSMILYAPKAQEKLESLGIPVLVDRSSYEKDVFGRIEWVKAYGALLDREEEADARFAAQKAITNEWSGQPDTGKTAAFFSVRPDGTVSVRKGDDMVPDMIEKAGGHYVFHDLTGEGASHAVPLTMEAFYAGAKDADYLIYNGIIESPLTSVQDLLDLSPLFADFRAVQEDHVFQADKRWYESTMSIGDMLRDFHIMFTDGDPAEFTFLEHIGN